MKYFFILFLVFGNIKNNNCPNSYILVSKPSLIVGCGGMAFAYEFMFMDNRDSSTFLAIIYCPDGYKEDFFKEDKKYCIKFSKDTVINKIYVLANRYDNDSLMKKRIVERIEPEK